MLTKGLIENLIHMRLPDEQMRDCLLGMTADKIDANVLESFVQTLRDAAEYKQLSLSEAIDNAIDCSGTGGSGISHFNASTMVAFVLAAGGLKVVKCGNRKATSNSGSFDLLQVLGFPLELPVQEIPALVEKTGLIFLYAPQFYPMLGQLATVRSALRVKTIFNYVGPLLNPVNPSFRILGVCDRDMQRLIAEWLSKSKGFKSGLVVRGESGIDEFDAHGASNVYEVRNAEVTSTTYVSPYSSDAVSQEVVHFTPEDNATIFYRLIEGEDRESRFHKTVCLNAGAGFYITDKASTINDGYELARELLLSGAVREKFESVRRSYGQCVS